MPPLNNHIREFKILIQKQYFEIGGLLRAVTPNLFLIQFKLEILEFNVIKLMQLLSQFYSYMSVQEFNRQISVEDAQKILTNVRQIMNSLHMRTVIAPLA